MSDMPAPVCPECGARVEQGSDRCELCGTALSEDTALPFEEEEAHLMEASSHSNSDAVPVCAVCGWENPVGALFCNQCGSPLSSGGSVERDAPLAGKTGSSINSSLVWVGIAGILALIFVGITRLSSSSPEKAEVSSQAETASSATLEPEPIPAELREQVAQLEKAISEASDEDARIAHMRELVIAYAQAGLFVRAAELQKQIAEQLDTPEAWAMVGHLYYDGMLQSQGERRVRMAREAVAAYQRSLELNPDNLDVRTDMAVAYLNIPDKPMEAIRQINIVLERNPDHLQANFNKGIMLAQIGRVEQAIAHFEKVKQLSSPESEAYKRAQQMIEALQQASQ